MNHGLHGVGPTTQPILAAGLVLQFVGGLCASSASRPKWVNSALACPGGLVAIAFASPSEQTLSDLFVGANGEVSIVGLRRHVTRRSRP